MFNPNYENLPNFKSFVARQPAHDHYPYTDSGNCACARYLKSEDRYTDNWLSSNEMRAFNELAMGKGLFSDDWTFGRLLGRIEAKEKELV